MYVKYYANYEEYDIPIGQRNVDKFIESLIYFFDTGNTCLENRANSDVMGHRGDGFMMNLAAMYIEC